MADDVCKFAMRANEFPGKHHGYNKITSEACNCFRGYFIASLSSFL